MEYIKIYTNNFILLSFISKEINNTYSNILFKCLFFNNKKNILR